MRKLQQFQVQCILLLGLTVNSAWSLKQNPEDKYTQVYSDFKHDAQEIIDYMTQGEGRGHTYKALANLSDTYGNRLIGSQGFEEAHQYFMDLLKTEGFDNVHTETVEVPEWIRGTNDAILVEPRHHPMSLLALRMSGPTHSGGLEAEAVVVQSFDELDKLGKTVAGKIVVYNQPWVNYEQSVDYRANGATKAADYGAVGVLVRSAASHSNYSPATGDQNDQQTIPSACITIEDAEMLWRLQLNGHKLVIRLNMTSHNTGKNVVTPNTIAQLTGTQYPDQVVMLSGHFDSWDVGTGAMDDGGGVMLALETLRVLKKLGLLPKRTIRALFWTGEEEGHYGSLGYYKAHKGDTSEKFVFVSESDAGAFPPSGLNFTGSKNATKYMYSILKLLTPLNATRLYPLTDGGDVQPWIKDGIPGVWLENADWDDYYFRFHHTNGDTMTVFKPEHLDKAAAVMTVLAHVVANMDDIISNC